MAHTIESGVILMYHRVVDVALDTHHLCVRPRDFGAHLDFLHATCHVMPLSRLVEQAKQSALPPRSVALTFDDGYIDALTAATPMLAAADVPATFFLTTDRFGEAREYWWDQLEHVFLANRFLPTSLKVSLRGDEFDVRTSSEQERLHAHDRLRAAMYVMPAQAQAAMMDELFEWSGIDPAPRDTHRVLSAAELQALASRSGNTIGAHTRNHLALSHQSAADQYSEISSCKSVLEQAYRVPVSSFSYPYGDFSETTEQIVRSCGLDCAVTVRSGVVRPETNPLQLPRVEVRSWERDEFAARIDAVFSGASGRSGVGTR